MHTMPFYALGPKMFVILPLLALCLANLFSWFEISVYSKNEKDVIYLLPYYSAMSI